MSEGQAEIAMNRYHDSLGVVDVDAEAYFGAQTARAIDNFQISGIAISHYPVLIHALAYVKKAAAMLRPATTLRTEGMRTNSFWTSSRAEPERRRT